MEKQEYLKRPPANCKEFHHLAPFIGYEYMKRPPHEINGVTRCDYCGLVMRKPLTVREAGRKGSVELDDPRVMKSLILNKDAMERLYHEKDGRGGAKPEMEIFQVPRSYGGARG